MKLVVRFTTFSAASRRRRYREAYQHLPEKKSEGIRDGGGKVPAGLEGDVWSLDPRGGAQEAPLPARSSSV